MNSLFKYSALLAAAVVLMPIDGFAQGHGQSGNGNQAGARERAQVERGQTERDRDRIQDRDRIHQADKAPAGDQVKAQERNRKQVQEQNQVHAPGTGNGADADIYGHNLMSVEERNRYREQLRLVESDPEQKTRFMAQHREQMQSRAKAQGVVIKEDGETEKPE
jgi:hypothetical protein